MKKKIRNSILCCALFVMAGCGSLSVVESVLLSTALVEYSISEYNEEERFLKRNGIYVKEENKE
tara:strand:- start:184 stop:375 length:192 start_codon:yes stop_codon:yes gene_type:complete